MGRLQGSHQGMVQHPGISDCREPRPVPSPEGARGAAATELWPPLEEPGRVRPTGGQEPRNPILLSDQRSCLGLHGLGPGEPWAGSPGNRQQAGKGWTGNPEGTVVLQAVRRQWVEEEQVRGSWVGQGSALCSPLPPLPAFFCLPVSHRPRPSRLCAASASCLPLSGYTHQPWGAIRAALLSLG